MSVLCDVGGGMILRGLWGAVGGGKLAYFMWILLGEKRIWLARLVGPDFRGYLAVYSGIEIGLGMQEGRGFQGFSQRQLGWLRGEMGRERNAEKCFVCVMALAGDHSITVTICRVNQRSIVSFSRMCITSFAMFCKNQSSATEA